MTAGQTSFAFELAACVIAIALGTLVNELLEDHVGDRLAAFLGFLVAVGVFVLWMVVGP